MAIVGQVALATGAVEVKLIGRSIGFDHPKVVSKLQSWNIKNSQELLDGLSQRYDTLDDLKINNQGSRLVGTVVKGGLDAFKFSWRDGDIIVLGGANGLSAQDARKMDALVTIPMMPAVEFLTVGTVVSALTYYILNKRIIGVRT
jgi:tRNA G18 (ribose-2'-O)-methylase SpoU